jgi:branched-chain amino acid transport system substrate-binding protein
MSKPIDHAARALRVTMLASVSLISSVVGGCKTAENKEPPPSTSTPAGGSASAPAAATPGVTATEIKIGQSMPYSGPASAYGAIGKGAQAYFKMINDKGGINGRKVTLISLDDGYLPAKAVENTRKLVEGENVALIFNNVGTANNLAIQKYLNDKKVPHLFVATGADRWSDHVKFPWTMGFQPCYRQEAKVYSGYLLKEKPDARLCVLYQNDDFGKEYLTGLREGLGDKHDKIVIKTLSYEVSDPTVDSQVVSLQAAGCDTLLTAAGPKFAAQVIRRIHDIGWKPLHLLTGTSVSRGAVLQPAGLDKATGIITAGYIKDIADPSLADDPGMNEYRAFAKAYLPGVDLMDGNLVYAFGVSQLLARVLTQAGDDLSRENIMKQAANLKDIQLGVIAPGILINTSPTDFRPYSQYRLARFNGNFFEPFTEPMTVE